MKKTHDVVTVAADNMIRLKHSKQYDSSTVKGYWFTM